MQSIIKFIFLFFVFQGLAQNNIVQLSIHVADNQGAGIASVQVELHENNEFFYTNAQGWCIIPGLRAGQIHIHISQPGYEMQQMHLLLQNDTVIQVSLSPTIFLLKQVVIEDKLTKNSRTQNTLPVTFVGQEDIDIKSSGGIAVAAKSIPGVDVSMIGSGSSKPIIRGLGQNRVAVFEQNIRQEGQQWGMDHSLEIDPNTAQSIQVVKGPNSLLYGSDAIGGVLIINSPSISFSRQSELVASSGYETNNRRINNSLLFSQSDSLWYIRSIISFSKFGDYKVPSDQFSYLGYQFPISDGNLKNTAGEKMAFQLKGAVHRPKGIWNFSYSAFYEKNGFFSGAHGIPSAIVLVPDESKMDIDLPFQRVIHQKGVINYSRFWGKHWIRLDAGYQNNSRGEYSTPHSHGLINLPQTNEELKLILHSVSIYIKDYMTIKEGNSVISGFSAEFQKNDFGGYYFLMPKYENSKFGAFIHNEKELSKKIKFIYGIRGDLIYTHIHRYFDSNVSVPEYRLRSPELFHNGRSFTFSLGINFQQSKNKVVKINFGKGFRMPLANELAINGIHHGSMRHEMGDSLLKAEQVYQLDFDYLLEWKKTIMEFSAFGSYFPSLIYLNPTGEFSFLPDAGQIYKYQQAEAFRTGMEISLEYAINQQTHLEAFADYVFAQNLETNFPMPLTTASKASLTFRHQLKSKKFPLKIEFENLFYAPQNRVAQNEEPTQGSWIENLYFRWSNPLKKAKLDIILGVYNLFNQKYYNHLSYYRILNLPEPGRNIQLKFVLTFNQNSNL